MPTLKSGRRAFDEVIPAGPQEPVAGNSGEETAEPGQESAS